MWELAPSRRQKRAGSDRADIRAGRYVGLDVRGCGGVAASAATCALLERGETP